MNKYINKINITFFILIFLGGYAIFGLLGKDKTAEYTAEYKVNLERIKEIQTQKEIEIQTQKEIYEAHKKKVAEMDKKISEITQKNNALSILIGEDNMKLIPEASAHSFEPLNGNSTPTSAEPPKGKIDKLHTMVCDKQPNSPLCKDKDLFIRLHKITIDRTDVPYMFEIMLGITNSESSLGTNYAPKHCTGYNNLGGIKWRKTDDGRSIKDQPIPQSNGCWLYKFDSIEDYWISKVNSIRYGYKGCLVDNPRTALQCMSKWYVKGDGKIIKHSWVNNASIFIQ